MLIKSGIRLEALLATFQSTRASSATLYHMRKVNSAIGITRASDVISLSINTFGCIGGKSVNYRAVMLHTGYSSHCPANTGKK